VILLFLALCTRPFQSALWTGLFNKGKLPLSHYRRDHLSIKSLSQSSIPWTESVFITNEDICLDCHSHNKRSFVLSDSRLYHKDLNSRSMKLIILFLFSCLATACSFCSSAWPLFTVSSLIPGCSLQFLFQYLATVCSFCSSAWPLLTVSVLVPGHCLQFLF